MTPELVPSYMLGERGDQNLPFFVPGWSPIPEVPPPLSGDATTEPMETEPMAAFVNSEMRQGPRGGKKPLRPRQQLLNNLQMEMEKQTQALKEAQDERERLQQRIKVLEVVLPVREQQVQLLKQKRHAAGEQDQPLSECGMPQRTAVLRITELPTAASSDSLAAESGTSSHGENGPGGKIGANGTGTATSSPRACNGAAEALPTSAANMQVVRAAATKHMVRQFMSIWNVWVRNAGLLLHAHDARPHDPGPKMKLTRLHDQLIPNLRAMRLEDPHLAMSLICLNFETGERDEPPPDSHWISVVQGLRLTTEQVADCCAAVSLYRERMARVMSERKNLASALGTSLPLHGTASAAAAAAGKGSAAGPAAAAGATKGGAGGGGGEKPSLPFTLLHAVEVTEKLQRNVVEEGQAVEFVRDFMGSCLFSLVQLVRASVLSYPYFPDAVSILNTVVSTMGGAVKHL